MKLYTVPLAPNPMRVTLYLAEREALGALALWRSYKAVWTAVIKGHHLSLTEARVRPCAVPEVAGE